jgi:hypothetical protein
MRRLLAAAAALACGIALAMAPTLTANAVTASPAAVTRAHAAAKPATTARPQYSRDITITIKCATWKGELAWGGNGNPIIPAYIDVSGTLRDTCHKGYAQLFLHWDTIDNPKNVLVKKVNENSSARTPYSTHDDLNTYKDIYVYVCSDYEGYRCSKHEGPGA